MSDETPQNESKDRDGKGRFAKGCKGGPGNPHAQHVARLRAELFRAVKPADLRQVVEALLRQAKTGDVQSIKELLQRLLGPPVEFDLLERLEALEAKIAQVQGNGDRP